MLRPKSHPVKSEGRSISGSSSIGEAPGGGGGLGWRSREESKW